MSDKFQFTVLKTDGEARLGEIRTPRDALIFLTAFGDESSLGLVRIFFAELSEELARAVPPS